MSRKFQPYLGTYFWQENPNFGDSLAPIILEHFTNAKTDWAAPSNSDIVVTGSVLDILPPHGWRGIVAGAGALIPWGSKVFHQIDLSQATVLGVRGPLTANLVLNAGWQSTDLVLGDPVLLVSELVPRLNLAKFGVVPHCSDTELFAREFARAEKYDYARPILIDPTWDPMVVVALISGCERIVSSSLHGLVVADSYGIPRRSEKFADMETNSYEGGDFKFRDYGASIDQPIEWGTLQVAPKDKIEEIQSNLFRMFQELNRIINE